MNVTRLMTAAAFAALIAGPAVAQQSTTTQSTTGNMSTSGSMSSGQTSTSGSMSTDTTMSGGTTNSSTSWSNNAGASTSGAGMMTSMNGNVQVVANAPIPDTAENRARYGQPESRAGRARVGEGPVQSLSRSGSR